MQALDTAERDRAEEAIMDRILGLPRGGVDVLGPPAELRAMLAAWQDSPES